MILREPSRPVIVANALDKLPLAQEGKMDPRLAAKVLDRYFDWNGVQQHRFLSTLASA